MFKRKISKRDYKRKLVTRSQAFATISVPIDVLNHWSGVSDVVLQYDSELDVLLITPANEVQHDD